MIIDTIPHKLANHIVTYNNNSNQKKRCRLKWRSNHMKLNTYIGDDIMQLTIYI